MKKIIGLIPLYDDEKDSYWMLPGYMKGLEECGAVPIMLPLTTSRQELEACMELCDGLLMTGGHDVNPAMYGESKHSTCGISSDTRDKMEEILFHMALGVDKPVLGICRGIQLMNVLMGGSLYQDLPTEHKSQVEHHMSAPYDREAHKVEILEGNLLTSIYGAGMHGVNSYHHQAIKELAPNVVPMAVSEDGLVEAICVPDKKFVVGVQWHPEFSYQSDERCRKILQAFVDAC